MKPVPFGTDRFSITLFRKFSVAVVAVVEVVAYTPVVLKFVPVVDAFRLMKLYETMTVVELVVVVTLKPRTEEEVVAVLLANGALISPIRLLYTFAIPEVPREVMEIPETVGAPVELL